LNHLVLDDPNALDALADDWRRLWTATRPVPPMLEYRWVHAWWQLHRQEGKLLLVVVADEGGRPAGIAPLYVRRDARAPVKLLRTVHFLGTGEREADEVVSEYLGWLAPPETAGAVTRAVADVLSERAAIWDRLHLINIEATQNLQAELPTALAPLLRDRNVATRPTFRIAARPLEEYVSGLSSSNFRHRCRRALRASAEAGLELVTVTRPDEARALFTVLRELHQQRWVERGHPGAFDSAVFREFHERLLPIYLADGSAWLVGLRQGSRWLAARYHLRTGDRVFDYVSGVDTNAPAALGPGLLLTLHGLQWCAENGVRTYDLLGGEYEYKRKLATEVAEIFDLDLYNSTLASQLWLAARRLRWKLRGGGPATSDRSPSTVPELAARAEAGEPKSPP
jgi:CelD/BcsL family acetyltransferase involved in cellulose biosynthesis